MVRRKNAALAMLGIVLMLIAFAAAKEMEPLDARLVEVYRTVAGTTEADAVRDAALQAVRMCIARIYLSDELIMARHLLDKYVETEPERFVYSREVVAKEYAGDQIRLTQRLFVDNAKLLGDLREKRFLFKPLYRPYFTAFVDETLDGVKASYTTGNKTIADTILDRGGKWSDERMTSPSADQDVSHEPALFNAALTEAERAGIEIFITGASATRLIERKELYYDVYSYYRTETHLKLIRVDNGEMLGEAKATASAANTNPDKAVEISVRKAVGDAASQLYDDYKKVWNKQVLNEVDYQILLTDVSKENLALFLKAIATLGTGVETYVRNYDKNIAVINVVYGGKRDKLIEAIASAHYPRTRLIAENGNMLEFQVEN